MKFCVYDRATGVIRQSFDADERDAKKQIGEGEAIYFGEADTRRHRIDPETISRIDMKDFDPQDGSVWIKSEGRWMSPSETMARENSEIRARIEALERKQHRRVRELLEASDPRLREISREIETQRAKLSEPI